MQNKPRMGLLFFASERFCPLGDGTVNGSYQERKIQEAERIKNTLSDCVDISFDKICFSSEDSIQAVKLMKQSAIDFINVIFMSWSEDECWIKVLSEISDVPIIYASIVRNDIDYIDTFDENDFVDFLSYGSLVGFLVGSGSLKRFAPSVYDVFIGSLSELKNKLNIFGKAAMAKNQLKRSVVSLLSHYNEAMWVTYVDPYNVFKTFGAKLKFISIPELTRSISRVSDNEVWDVLKKLKHNYTVLPDVDEYKFFASVKASIGMEQAARDIGTDLLVLNDIEKPLLENVGLRPGFSPVYSSTELTVVPEGDIGAGLAVYILKLISGGHVNFIEPFYIDGKRKVFAAGHAGPNDYTQCRENVIISRDTRFSKSSYKYAGAPFAWYVFPKGLKTILHISECSGKMKMAFSTVECLETKHYLASYSHADFRHTHMSNEEFFKKLAEFGVTQHYAIVDGDYTNELACLAKLYRFEYIKI